MTLWETTKVFLSKLVSSEAPNSNKPDDEELEMAVFEVSRAYFMAPSARGRRRGRNPAAVDVRVQNGYCEWAKRSGGDTQRGWLRCWSGNFPALFYNEAEGRAVHGDDSLLLESGNHTTGCDRHCPRSIQCGSPTDWDRHICRVASCVGEDQDGQRYVQIEPDARHLGCVLRNVGLHGITTKSLCSYGFKLDDKEPTLRSREPPLNRQETTMYRSCVLRLAYLAQDRGDFGEPVKCLARSMATPTPGALRDLKKVARYLRDRRHLALRFKHRSFQSVSPPS